MNFKDLFSRKDRKPVFEESIAEHPFFCFIIPLLLCEFFIMVNLPPITHDPKTHQIDQNSISNIQSLLAIFSFLAIAISSWIASKISVRNNREDATRSREERTIDLLLKWEMDPLFIEQRKAYDTLVDSCTKKFQVDFINQEEFQSTKRTIQTIFNRYEIVALAINKNRLSHDIFMERMGKQITQEWMLLFPFIHQIRIDNNDLTLYRRTQLLAESTSQQSPFQRTKTLGL